MHRMRRLVALAGLALLGSSLLAGSASAALIKPDAQRTYPDVSADINGVVNYTYNSSTGTGNFHLTNTPYLIATGNTSAQEFAILPNSSDGIRQQVLNIATDGNGNILAGNPTNSYALYGTATITGTTADGQTYNQTFSGLLLSGTPTSFGSQDLKPLGIQDSSLFDVGIKVTGGALAQAFGDTAYMRITPELGSTFRGKFDENFSAQKATSNTRTDNANNQPFPIPEPSTILLVLAGGFGLFYRQRHRLAGR
jgi:hypothetical protein